MQNTDNAIYIFFIILVLIGSFAYVVNAWKFVGCDFESDYKCEVVHGIGVIVPPASVVTVWFAKDES